jgi:hypothetical protein
MSEPAEVKIEELTGNGFGGNGCASDSSKSNVTAALFKNIFKLPNKYSSSSFSQLKLLL